MHGDVGNPASRLYPGLASPYHLSREGRDQRRGSLGKEFQQNSRTWEVFSFTWRLAVVQTPKLEQWDTDSNTCEATSERTLRPSSMKAWGISTKKANYLVAFQTERAVIGRTTQRGSCEPPTTWHPFRSSFLTEAVSTSPHHMLEGRVAEITPCEKTSSITNCNFLFLSETSA